MLQFSTAYKTLLQPQVKVLSAALSGLQPPGKQPWFSCLSLGPSLPHVATMFKNSLPPTSLLSSFGLRRNVASFKSSSLDASL